MIFTIKNREYLLQDYNAQIVWLQSLIPDKTGAHYLEKKDPETQLREFRAGVARTADFLDFVGNPQQTFKSIHVAGTSGKGSVVSILASILKQCGFQTAHHVSPFLQICTEKLLLNGQRIPLNEFIELVREFRKSYERWQSVTASHGNLKYGEAWAILAFLWFAKSQADWAIMETGVGGRYDPSNVLPSKLAVITNVDYDHIHALGPTLRDIALHKAGIIKKDQPAITASQNPDVLAVLENEANMQNAPLYRLGKEFDFQVHQLDENGLVLSVDAAFHSYPKLRVALPGVFQAENTALSIASMDLLAERYGFSIPREALEKALASVEIQGRMEIIQREPLVILDGAHNPHKMQSLVESMERIYPGRSITVILGILMTKDADYMIKALLPLARQVIVTKPNVLGKPSLELEELARKIREIDPEKELITANTVTDAIDFALKMTSSDELILITGSLYMLGEARNYWISPESLLLDS